MMKEGGKAKLTIPAALAYGSSESPNIPPNSVLQFEIELLEVQGAEAAGAQVAGPPPSSSSQVAGELAQLENRVASVRSRFSAARKARVEELLGTSFSAWIRGELDESGLRERKASAMEQARAETSDPNLDALVAAFDAHATAQRAVDEAKQALERAEREATAPQARLDELLRSFEPDTFVADLAPTTEATRARAASALGGGPDALGPEGRLSPAGSCHVFDIDVRSS